MSRRNWKIFFGYGLAISALCFVAWYAGLNGAGVVRQIRFISPLPAAVALLAFATHVTINSWAFSLLSRSLGARLPVRELCSAWAASLIAKYVPGGMWHIVGRGMLLGKMGLPVRITMITGVLEQGISLALCILIASGVYIGLRADDVFADTVLIAACITLATILLALKSTNVVDRLLLALAIGTYASAMIPYALGYVVLVHPGNTPAFLYALFAGTVSGVVAIFVPGGLGVREASTVLLFSSPDLDQVMAAMLAGRLLLLICDVGGSILGTSVLRVSGRTR